MVSFNTTDYFKFNVTNKETESVTIVLNSVSGDADLYVSRKETHPSSESFEQSKLNYIIY